MRFDPYNPETQPDQLRVAVAVQAHLQTLDQLEAEALAEADRIRSLREAIRSRVSRFPVELTRGIGGTR